MTGPVDLRCPVCQARFRETRECSRCGANLAVLMSLAGEAYLARQMARRALRTGEVKAASAWAGWANRRHRTASGVRLEELAALAGPVGDISPAVPAEVDGRSGGVNSPGGTRWGWL